MEQLVAEPIEAALSGLDDVNEIGSFSGDGIAIINVEFSWDTNPSASTTRWCGR
jgi:multidrug efflux pump subunit AcrB